MNQLPLEQAPALDGQNTDIIIHGGWVITMNQPVQALAEHSVLITGNQVQAVLPREQAKNIAATTQIELPNHVLMPGLINSHGHAAMSLFRGMADDTPLDIWLNEHIWPAEGQWVSEEFVRDGAELAIAEMIRSGTTTFSDMYFFPNITAKVAQEAGIRAQLSFPIMDFPSAWGSGAEDYINKGMALRDEYKHSDTVNVIFGPHAPYTVATEALEKIATYAHELDCGIHIHTQETQAEVEQSLATFGQRPLERLNSIGLLGPKTQCVHLAAINEGDIQLLADTKSHAIHCPRSNMKLASGFCPSQALIDAGVNLAIGTDGAASNNGLDLFAELNTAALLAKVVSKNAAAVPDSAALTMATVNGAKALDFKDCGTLNAGAAADVIAIDLSAIEQQPIYDPISHLAYTGVANHVSHSWINGKAVMADRELLTLDQSSIVKRTAEWRRKIKAA